jgi:filamentous hemagglutinin
LPPTSKTFDKFDATTGEAISAKTLNTLSVSYITNPQRIYWRLKRYADAAADYEPRAKFDLAPSKIESKTIHLAIPEYTSPTQWRYLLIAIRYGRERGVSLVITRIRE